MIAADKCFMEVKWDSLAILNPFSHGHLAQGNQSFQKLYKLTTESPVKISLDLTPDFYTQSGGRIFDNDSLRLRRQGRWWLGVLESIYKLISPTVSGPR